MARPVALFKDPFRNHGNVNYIALCATYKPEEDGSMTPLTVGGVIRSSCQHVLVILGLSAYGVRG